jgi:catalase (peroxidase I)
MSYLLLLLVTACLAAKCPFGHTGRSPHGSVSPRAAASHAYLKAAQALDWDAVYADVVAVLESNSPEVYPADDMLDGTTSYGPFFIRQA